MLPGRSPPAVFPAPTRGRQRGPRACPRARRAWPREMSCPCDARVKAKMTEYGLAQSSTLALARSRLQRSSTPALPSPCGVAFPRQPFTPSNASTHRTARNTSTHRTACCAQSSRVASDGALARGLCRLHRRRDPRGRRGAVLGRRSALRVGQRAHQPRIDHDALAIVPRALQPQRHLPPERPEQPLRQVLCRGAGGERPGGLRAREIPACQWGGAACCGVLRRWRGGYGRSSPRSSRRR